VQVSACISQNRMRSTGSVVPSSPSIGWPLSKPPAGFGRQATTSILGSVAESRRLIASLPVLTPKRTRSRIPDRSQSSPAACRVRTRRIPVNNASRQRSSTCCVREGSVMGSRSVKFTSVPARGHRERTWFRALRESGRGRGGDRARSRGSSGSRRATGRATTSRRGPPPRPASPASAPSPGPTTAPRALRRGSSAGRCAAVPPAVRSRLATRDPSLPPPRPGRLRRPPAGDVR
jgi:hypothetical protein